MVYFESKRLTNTIKIKQVIKITIMGALPNGTMAINPTTRINKLNKNNKSLLTKISKIKFETKFIDECHYSTKTEKFDLSFYHTFNKENKSVFGLQKSNFTFKNNKKEAIARVNETYLYKDDLKTIFNSGISKQDSILLANSYINNWVKQQLLLAKAQINLEDNQVDFEELVKKYREDLYINSYKEAVVKQYLNYEITPADIDKFYAENNQNFKLNEELVKLRYMKLGKNLINKKELVKLQIRCS